jgi:SpoVK/Ycf46/Vps4 family AAA+-type ATPase
VASGELGTEAHVAEERLLKIFGLAQAWHAILLLDEADIFLARRTTKDIVRNAFVSVFLRNMEYYQGIMLLTTNRHEEFDEAFQSRIHIQIPYEPADSSRRTAIWKNLLDDQGTHHDLDAEAFVRIGQKYELNGRELKNLLSMSLAISRSKHIPLDEETIDKMFNLCHYTDL